MATALFDTVPKDHFGFFTEGVERPAFKKLMNTLDLKKKDVSKAIGVGESAVRFDEKISAEVRERMTEWANLVNLVAAHFEGDVGKTVLWFKVPNPLLGNVSPRDMIRFGRCRKLQRFILDAMEENVPPKE